MYTLTLKKGEEKRIKNFHPWVYANEVAKIEGKDAQGSVAKVVAFDGRFLGYGFINHASKIIVRMVTWDETPVDEDLFLNRIKNAKSLRERLGLSDNYRAVFAESDLLPGLIVDKYGDVLSVQFLTLGMEVRKEMLTKILVKVFSPVCVYERSDVSVRKKEGLPEVKGVLYGRLPDELIIEENGVKMYIDVENGQKTGYFLDQKENRDDLKRYVKDRTVLDCFCNQGGFSLCAAKYGAKEIVAADVSALALEHVRKNAALNGFSNITTVEADVFTLLRDYKKEKRTFDVIVLDPPAFAKTADAVKAGYKGYLDVNCLALKLLNEGGILVTCSCSQHMTPTLFTRMLTEASAYTGIPVRLLEFRHQSPDHATMLGSDEGTYLKVAVLYRQPRDRK
ncbi:MAG: class I SAM-dependent rRNA methyltransferase [Clostridia bacterium]|nr:class I SAM-dependent rRNA methyltransferase [Clostridia bacterium]